MRIIARTRVTAEIALYAGLEMSRALGRETCYVRAETVPECELHPARSFGLVSESSLFSFSTEERATVGWEKVSVV